MTPAAWFTLLVTFVIAIMVPGTDTFLLLRLGVRERRAAVFGAVGIMIGNTIWTLASVLGLAALMRTVPGILPVLQIIGAAVLIWIGVQSIRSGMRTIRKARAHGRSVGASDRTPQRNPSDRITEHPLRLGIITNLSNPKALLFFAALFSQILPPNATWWERAEIVIVLLAIGLAWFVSFALLTSSRAFQHWFARATPVIDFSAGAVFLLVALVILIELGATALS